MAETAAEVSVVVHASRPQVWTALTDPGMIKQYFMGATVATDWQVGSPITFSGQWQGKPFTDKGEVLVFSPEDELSYSHWSPLTGTADAPENYHVVDVTLDDADDGTRVTLTQANLVGGLSEGDRAAREDFEKNWTTVLEGLRQTVEQPAGP